MKYIYKPPCIVSIFFGNDKTTDGSGSGVIIDADNGYILTSATILAPIAAKNPDLFEDFEKTTFHFNSSSVNAEVIFEREQIQKDKPFSVNDGQTSFTNCNSSNERHIMYHDADILQVFTCLNFSEAFNNLLGGSNWTFATDEIQHLEKTKELDIKTEKTDTKMYQKIVTNLMTKFILLKTSDFPVPVETNNFKIQDLLGIQDKLEICATPFGNLSPEVFMNSWSSGIVSNVYGKDNVLILTDARCVPGSEGGPVYCVKSKQKILAGIVVSSLCWKSNEWVGLSIVCSIRDILSSLSRNIHNKEIISGNGPCQFSSVLDNVVLVKVGGTWGSGIVIHDNPVYILTCSHVIKGCNSANSIITIKHNSRKSLIRTKAVYHNNKSFQFDLAVLRASNLSLNSKIRAPVHPVEGERVYTIGHAIFNHTFDLAPTVTSGVVSKVIYFQDVPVMIQTTCAVHPGASGGALVNEDGNLVGIVVSNTKDIENGACYPHISLCIPAITIWTLLLQYIKTENEHILNNLSIQNRYVNDLWSLGSPTQRPVVSSKL